MPRKALTPLTEPMFYVLLCFHINETSGNEISEYVAKITDDRVRMGPGTLYTILSTFLSEKLIEKRRSVGRKIYYAITDKGEKMYQDEVNRLRKCVLDATNADLIKISQKQEDK